MRPSSALTAGLKLGCIALALAACSSNPSQPARAPSTLHGCAVDMPQYPPCEPSPQLVPDPYYPGYEYPYYPGTGVVLVPQPVPVPVAPPPPAKPPEPVPAPHPPPKHRRQPRPKPCKPEPGKQCP